MNGTVWVKASLCLAFSVLLAGCGAKATVDPRAEAPPPAVIEQDQDVNLVTFLKQRVGQRTDIVEA